LDDSIVEVEYSERRRRSARYLEAHTLRVVGAGEPYPALALCPASWVANEDAYCDLLRITETLSPPYRALVDTVFADDALLRRFVQGPSSIGGHHNQPGGNVAHAVAVSEIALSLVERFGAHCDADTALTACLLHDVGKADEYVAESHGQWRLSDRGRLIGHKLSSYELVSRALAKHTELLPMDRQMMLLHCLAASGAPDYVGLRPAASIEAFVVSFADRLSATGDLIVRNSRPQQRWGRKHHHLPRAPFRIISGSERVQASERK
jgi:3'-5' exoribonuclease